jgi:hypothetical protein
MGVPEEAFIRFLILTDFLRYHFDMVGRFSKKYRHLLSDSDYDSVTTLLKDYDGVKGCTRPEKGFRTRDVKFFQDMKSTVISERRRMTVVAFKDDADPEAHPYHNGLENQFIFNYPGSSGKIKEEFALKNLTNRKRKSPGDSSSVHDTNREALSMPLEDENY